MESNKHPQYLLNEPSYRPTIQLFSNGSILLTRPPVFIANRVAEILELTTVDEWNHVPTADDPADAGSRVGERPFGQSLAQRPQVLDDSWLAYSAVGRDPER